MLFLPDTVATGYNEPSVPEGSVRYRVSSLYIYTELFGI